jgi:multidrug efflux pump subunit AcrA (membrane-fusion protein)
MRSGGAAWGEAMKTGLCQQGRATTAKAVLGASAAALAGNFKALGRAAAGGRQVELTAARTGRIERLLLR